MAGKWFVITYPYAPIHAASDEVRVVELQTRHRTRVSHQASMHLSTPQIPQPHHAIGGAASERGFEHLNGADEICRPVAGPGRVPPVNVTPTEGRAGLSCSPHDVERLHATAFLEVPLPQSLVCRTRYEHIAPEVESGDLVKVSLQGEEGTVGHGSCGWIHRQIVWVFESNGVIVFLVPTKTSAVRIVVCLAQIPKTNGGVHAASRKYVVLYLQRTHRCRMALQDADATASIEVPYANGIIHSRRDHGSKRRIKIKCKDSLCMGTNLTKTRPCIEMLVKDGHGFPSNGLWPS